MIDPGRIVSALWSIFEDEIATGERVSFCFYDEGLQERLRSAGIPCESPIALVSEVALTCFDLDGAFVALRDEALRPIVSERSMAIVLVCQQVLAVEGMVQDRGGFSEHAYFPRLRAMMSPDLAPLSQNPFRFEEFEAIWRRFACEVTAVNGSSAETITFKFGVYSGANKARLFPLTQALLSRADLMELLRRGRVDRLSASDESVVWREVYRDRAYLSRRAQLLVGEGFQRDRIVEQVRAFATRRRQLPRSDLSAQSSEMSLELCVALDSPDGLCEGYRAFLMRPRSSEAIEDEERTARKVQAALSGRGYVICVLSSTLDYWRLHEREVEVLAHDRLLVLGDRFGLQRATAVLEGLNPPVLMDPSRALPLGASSNVHVCPVDLPKHLARLTKVCRGKILQEGDAIAARERYEWVGGICVDARSRKYLREALPSSIRFGDRVFDVRELKSAGDAPQSWSSLVRRIGELRSDANYVLRFPNGEPARLSVAVSRAIDAEHMGFKLEPEGSLAPTLDRLAHMHDALIGFAEPELPVRSPGVAELAAIIRSLTSSEGPGGMDIGPAISERVDASNAPAAVKILIKSLIARRSRSIV